MITYEIATTLRHGQTLYHKVLKNRDGSALRCRVNGKCKTWVTRPGQFKLPVKHGLRECFYIFTGAPHDTAWNPASWSVTEPTAE